MGVLGGWAFSYERGTPVGVGGGGRLAVVDARPLGLGHFRASVGRIGCQLAGRGVSWQDRASVGRIVGRIGRQLEG